MLTADESHVLKTLHNFTCSIYQSFRTQSPQGLRLALHGNALNTNRKSGVAFPLFILRLDERLWVKICV